MSSAQNRGANTSHDVLWTMRSPAHDVPECLEVKLGLSLRMEALEAGTNYLARVHSQMSGVSMEISVSHSSL